MKVSELIEKLLLCDPECEVFVAWESGIRQRVEVALVVNPPHGRWSNANEPLVVLTDEDEMRWFENPSFSDRLDWTRL